jgi:excisionase family DNA binding protein
VADGLTLEPLLSAAQVAQILRCTERYVWRLGRDGKLPRVLVGRKVLFDPADVTAFIAAAKEGPRPRARVLETDDSTPAIRRHI